MLLLARACKKKENVEVFTVSLRDIQKALQQKSPETAAVLPDWLHGEAHAFGRQQADTLAPHRVGVDHVIELQKDARGRDVVVPASPLYRRSTEELLVLRKTLTELLDKCFLRQSSSSISSPVLFVKKADGGLRFCCNYRKLNALSRRDAYPLPLIPETLRMIASAKWVSKVDVISAFH